MGENFACSHCSARASVFCLCTTDKVYLCQRCIGGHLAKPAPHAIMLTAAANHIASVGHIPAYQRREHAVLKVRDVLVTIRDRVEQERTSFITALSDTEEKYSRYLHDSFQQIHTEITAIYTALMTDIDRIATEISTLEANNERFSEDTLLFVHAWTHISEKVTYFVDYSGEFGKRLTMQCTNVDPDTGKIALKTMERWGVRPCNCEKCVEVSTIVCGERKNDRGKRENSGEMTENEAKLKVDEAIFQVNEAEKQLNSAEKLEADLETQSDLAKVAEFESLERLKKATGDDIELCKSAFLQAKSASNQCELSFLVAKSKRMEAKIAHQKCAAALNEAKARSERLILEELERKIRK